MGKNSSIYYYASDVSDILGVSETKAYAVIRELNDNLKSEGYIILRGRIPKSYFHKHFYGIEQQVS